MTEHVQMGIVHRGESVRPGPGGTILHTYWDKCQERYIREMLTREEWEEVIADTQ